MRGVLNGSCLLTILIMSGCSTLRSDISYPAVKANYPTAEFVAGGNLYHGSGEVSLYKGEPYNQVAFAIQGYFEGTIRIDSDRCGVAQSYTYTDHELFYVDIPGFAEESCIFDFVVQPTFPNSEKEETHSFKGRLLIKVIDREDHWYGLSSKLRIGNHHEVIMPSKGQGSATVLFRGCGSNYSDSFSLSSGPLKLYTEDVFGDVAGELSCTAEGVLSEDEGMTKLSWTVITYDHKYSILPIPRMLWSNELIAVSSEDTVGVLSMDQEYVLGHQHTFDFDPRIDHIVRAISTAGRSSICQWLSKDKVWKCLN